MKSSGVVGGIGIRARLTRDGNEHIPAGTVGILEPHELSIHGDIISARFYPGETPKDRKGFGLVVWPQFESIGEGER